MIRVIERLINMTQSKTENFSTLDNEIVKKHKISFIIAAILVQLLLLLFVKFLWNNYLVNTITIVNPVKSVWHIWAISILLRLIVQV